MKELLYINNITLACRKIIPEQEVSEVPIIFLHDSLGSISVWKQFPQMVSDATSLSAVVYDRQGYGGSDPFTDSVRNNLYLEEQADMLIAVLNELSIDTCILFGHSDGGSIALIAAAKYPQRIKAVITEGAHVFVEDITLEGIRKAREAYSETDLRTRLLKHHGDKTDALFDAWTDTWLNPEFKSWNIEHFLKQISCPVLTIYGEADEYGTLQQMESIATKVLGLSQTAVLPGIGHTPHKQAKEETIKAVLAFLNVLKDHL